MNTLIEIESAIESLPREQVEELAAWLEKHRAARSVLRPVDRWLAQARGAARSGTTTNQIMTMTRGEE